MDKAKANNVQIHLPTDFITGDKFDENATVGTTVMEVGIEDGWLVSENIETAVMFFAFSCVKFRVWISVQKALLIFKRRSLEQN